MTRNASMNPWKTLLARAIKNDPLGFLSTLAGSDPQPTISRIGTGKSRSMNRDERLHFRDSFRDARTSALRDAESFDQLLFALERLGRFLSGEYGGLNKYACKITELAGLSPLAKAIPNDWREFHIPFNELYAQMRLARNAALHEGSFARHLTTHAVTIALILEDALMDGSECVGDFMVQMAVCAFTWQPLSFIRQAMLANSFSFMPVNIGSEGSPEWRLISDFELACFLRGAASRNERERALSTSLGQAVKAGDVNLVKPFVCQREVPACYALREANGLPILILSSEHNHLLGIATPFDLL